MLELPLVSIVVTSYNYEKYIEECLSSVLNQTYRPIECIIIDDCSTDNSVKVIQNFINKNKIFDISFKLIQQETNTGQLGGFVRGIKEASGVFLSFLDADDILLPEFVNLQVQAHFETNTAMSVCQQVEFDQDSRVHSLFSLAAPQKEERKAFSLSPKSFSEFQQTIENEQFISNEIEIKTADINSHPFGKWHWGPTSNVMFRKSALELFTFANSFETWKYCADKLIYNYAHLLGGTCFIYANLTVYRRHNKKGFSNFSITGDKRFFTPRSSEIMTGLNKALFSDTLKIFVNGKESFIQSMDYHGILDIIRLMVKNRSDKEIEENMDLLKEILDCSSEDEVFAKLKRSKQL